MSRVTSHEDCVSGTDYAHSNLQVFTQVVTLPGVYLPFPSCLFPFLLSQI